MKLKGKIFNSKTNESLFGANIYVSDKNGKLLIPTNGAVANPDGKYTLDNVPKNAYITVSYMGYKKEVYPINNTENKTEIERNFGLLPQTKELNEFEVIEYKDKPLKTTKNNNKTIAFIGIGLASVLIGTLIYKSLK